MGPVREPAAEKRLGRPSALFTALLAFVAVDEDLLFRFKLDEEGEVAGRPRNVGYVAFVRSGTAWD